MIPAEILHGNIEKTIWNEVNDLTYFVYEAEDGLIYCKNQLVYVGGGQLIKYTF